MHWPDRQGTDDAHDKGNHNGEEGSAIADAFAVGCGHKLSPKVGVAGLLGSGGDCEKPGSYMQGVRQNARKLFPRHEHNYRYKLPWLTKKRSCPQGMYCL